MVVEVQGTPASWDTITQNTLVTTLRYQYSSLGLDLPANFERLSNPISSTVTTGHQLQLFGGPAFLHYKTITTIRKAAELQESTSKPVIPIFWMASEDHDFEEVSWVHGSTSKHNWSRPTSGTPPVGNLPLNGLKEVLSSWLTDQCDDLQLDFRSHLELSLTKGESYSQFFIRLMHSWYGDKGLVVLDASHPDLKALFAPAIARELSGQGIAPSIKPGKVTPREINLFYSPPGEDRVGIINFEDGLKAGSKILNTSSTPWNEWVLNNAQALSPSVLLRPYYQEHLLANSHVILGPGEFAYWEQLPFDKPTLYLRDHILVVSEKDLALFSSLDWPLGFDETTSWKTIDDLIKVRIEQYLRSEFSVDSLEHLKSDDKLIQSVLTQLHLEVCFEVSKPKLSKARKTAVKKIRKAIKEILKHEISLIESAHKKVMNGIIPQDRWGNFHVLSNSAGGFKSLRDKLLETKASESPVMQVIVTSDQ